MDNEIIDELKVFTEAQKEKMTTTINALIEKNEEAVSSAGASVMEAFDLEDVDTPAFLRKKAKEEAEEQL